jgi:NAD(P)-dependent dehydrogenase (short-subunit alcohol dehydrogenase family)
VARLFKSQEEIADAVLFLMKNGFVTGITLTVDGDHSLV